LEKGWRQLTDRRNCPYNKNGGKYPWEKTAKPLEEIDDILLGAFPDFKPQNIWISVELDGPAV
jgi:hypothetical protein